MYKTQNGWTKEKMKNQIKKYNNGTGSYDEDRISYFYENPKDKNRCAVGCFIPDNHKALSFNSGVQALLETYKDLNKFMPLQNMESFQSEHDFSRNSDNMHQILFKWIDENVEDA